MSPGRSVSAPDFLSTWMLFGRDAGGRQGGQLALQVLLCRGLGSCRMKCRPHRGWRSSGSLISSGLSRANSNPMVGGLGPGLIICDWSRRPRASFEVGSPSSPKSRKSEGVNRRECRCNIDNERMFFMVQGGAMRQGLR